MFKKSFAFLLVFATFAATVTAQSKIEYPATQRGDQVDDYFGTKVHDPYRWLENNDETA